MQISQMEIAFSRVKTSLQNIYEKTSQDHEKYKIEKMEMRKIIKMR